MLRRVRRRRRFRRAGCWEGYFYVVGDVPDVSCAEVDVGEEEEEAFGLCED